MEDGDRDAKFQVNKDTKHKTKFTVNFIGQLSKVHFNLFLCLP